MHSHREKRLDGERVPSVAVGMLVARHPAVGAQHDIRTTSHILEGGLRFRPFDISDYQGQI